MYRQQPLWRVSSSVVAKEQQPGEQPMREGTALRSSLVNAKKVAGSRQNDAVQNSDPWDYLLIYIYSSSITIRRPIAFTLVLATLAIHTLV